MTEEIAYEAIDKMFEMFPNCDKYFVDLYGKGEPLLNLPIIFKIKEYCTKKSDQINREILVNFVTNGVLLTPRVAKTLQDKGILFGISLDGKKEIHDINRRDIHGSPTFDTIIQNLSKIENRDYIGCAVTIGESSFDLVESIKYLSKYFKTISYKPVRLTEGMSTNMLEEWKKEYTKLIIFLRDCSLNNDLKYIKILLNGEDYFGKFLYRCLSGIRVFNRCDAGITRFAINNDGKIYPCPALSTDTNNEIKADFKKNLIEQVNINFSSCNKCFYYYLCGGECSVLRKTLLNNDTNMCDFKKHLMNLAMYLTLEIAENNPIAYDELISFCKEKGNRFVVDKELEMFLAKHKENKFTEGKQIFDMIRKRY